MSDIINPVIQDWVMSLGWKEQTGLISAIRGVDLVFEKVNDEVARKSKSITRMIRFLVLNNADSRTGFMTDKVMDNSKVLSLLMYLNSRIDTGELSSHWFDHIMVAINIIKSSHPNPYVRVYWSSIYSTYNSAPMGVKDITVTSEDLKDIISTINNSGLVDDTSGVCYSIDKVVKPDEAIIVDMDDNLSIKDDTELKTNCVEANVKSDTLDLIVKRSEEGTTVVYDYDLTLDVLKQPNSDLFLSIVNNLVKLDVIIIGDWNIINDNMSADYNPKIPISRGSKIHINDAKPDTFMVDILSSKLLYTDKLNTLWLIDTKYNKNGIITLTISRPNYALFKWNTKNRSAYSIIIDDVKGESEEVPDGPDDKYIHGELSSKFV